MNGREWFKQAQFGMMVHWGLYALPAGEWKGRRMEHIGEWIQAHFRIPMAEYTQLAAAFNPILFDADEWVRLAKDAGMQYIVVTAKHHEGFAMFRSKVDPYNIVDATPFGRDVIGELADACRRHGLRLGLYYSQELDWHEPDGGGYGRPYDHVGNCSWSNDWDFPDNAAKDYSRCFERKIMPQVRELMTNYGDICLIWFDTPNEITPEQGHRLYDLVKSLQPECLVNSRIGNDLGDYGSAGDNEIPDDDKGNSLYETPATLNDTWGYKSYDNNWKSAERVREIRTHLNARGINYLLNVGPDALGRIPAPAVDILREVGRLDAEASVPEAPLPDLTIRTEA